MIKILSLDEVCVFTGVWTEACFQTKPELKLDFETILNQPKFRNVTMMDQMLIRCFNQDLNVSSSNAYFIPNLHPVCTFYSRTVLKQFKHLI